MLVKSICYLASMVKMLEAFKNKCIKVWGSYVKIVHNAFLYQTLWQSKKKKKKTTGDKKENCPVTSII